jgi:hypothetical protein
MASHVLRCAVGRGGARLVAITASGCALGAGYYAAADRKSVPQDAARKPNGSSATAQPRLPDDVRSVGSFFTQSAPPKVGDLLTRRHASG